MKLQLKHLAPYLAYKLPAKLSAQGIFNLDLEYPDENTQMVGYIDDFYFNDGDFCGIIRISDKISYDFEEGDYEIILRPLSDLTKEIEVNGEKFVPIEEINNHSEYNLVLGDSESIDYENLFWRDLCVLNMLNIFEIHDLMQKLFEWHFDVFGLIEAGLAIDINTLKDGK